MKNFNQFTKAFAIHAMIFSLIQSSFVFSVYAETKMETTEVTGNEILSVAKIAVATYGQFLGQKQQMIQQQISAQKNQALMQSLSPGCRKPDGTACYTVAGKFFPECPIPASMSTMPQNVCSAASPDPAAISTMITYESISKGWINYFDQMMNEGSNSQTPFGMKCLQDKQKALDSQLTEMVNNLTRLQDQLNKDKEIFKANNKQLLEDMTATNDELMGANGSGKNNLNLKTKDFAKYFSASCQSVIGEEALASGSAKGLLGMMQDLSPSNKRAADYNSNRAMIESDLRRDVEKIQKTIADGGLQDYFDGKITDNSKFQSLVSATQKQSLEFKLAKERISKELGKIGYQIPTMDKNFSVDFDEFLSGSQSFFKKQYINDCVTGADKSGTAISTEQILSSLKQKSTGSEGTARDKYKAALSAILNSDAFIQDKLNQIKALESTYKDISITYQNSNAQRVTSTPYDLYMKTLSACENRFSQDDTFSTGSSGVSQKKKVERGQALLRDLKSLHDNYSSQLGSRVLEQVMNCNGEAKKSGAACGDKNSFDSGSANFCMAQANQCANEVQGCYAEANKHVETRKAKLVAQANKFNANAAALIARSNALYTAQKNAVMDMVKVVQARFPGTNFEIPTGMFVSMPEMKKDAFGVDMANDGNVAFMDELPKKIDLLKKVFKDQQTAVNKEIGDYIEKQTAAMSREKSRWEALAGECKGMIDTSSREVAKMNNENLKKQAEQDGKVKSFCRKYQALASHPVGGCENAKKLSGEVDDVISRLVPSVATNVGEFNGACNAYGNETSSTLESCDPSTVDELKGQAKINCNLRLAAENKKLAADAQTPVKGKKGKKGAVSMKSLCEKGDGKNNDNKEFVEKVIAKLPAKERAKFASSTSKDEMAKALVSGNFDSVTGYDQLDDGNFFEDIKAIAGTSGDKICDQLMKIDKSTPPTADPIKTAAANGTKKTLDDFISVRPSGDAIKERAERAEIEKLVADKRTAAQKDRLGALEAADKVDATKKEELIAANKAAQEAMNDSAKETDPKPAQAVAALKEALASLQEASSKTTSPTELKTEELRRIGQQIEESTLCDSQAANTNIAKTFSGGLLPSGFDAGILGQSK